MHDLGAEITRLREHFVGAIEMLLQGDVSTLSPERLARRRAVIDALIRYAVQGVFPRNTYSEMPTPAFVDRSGSPCAVAILCELTGDQVLIERIVSSQNLGRVVEFAKDASFVQWLDDNGLTLEEAARIQPAYCKLASQVCVCEPYDLKVVAVGTLQGSKVTVTQAWPANSIAIGAIVDVQPYVTMPATDGDKVLIAGGALLQSPSFVVAYRMSSPDLVDTSTCNTEIMFTAPSTAPLSAFTSVANGQQTCLDSFAYLPGWEGVGAIGGCAQGSGAGKVSASSTSGAGGAGTGGSSAGDHAGGSGCGVAMLSPQSSLLLAILVGGLAFARRMRTHHDATKSPTDRD